MRSSISNNKLFYIFTVVFVLLGISLAACQAESGLFSGAAGEQEKGKGEQNIGSNNTSDDDTSDNITPTGSDTATANNDTGIDYDDDAPDSGISKCSAYETKLDYSAESYTISAPSGKVISSITIKVGTECLTFSADSKDGCYAVSGIGTANASVDRLGSGPSCKAISHVEVSYGGGQGDYVRLCHLNDDGSYTLVTALDDGTLGGHADHFDDIYPVPAAGCPQEEEPDYVQICHMNNTGSYEMLTVKDDGTLGGHGDHAEDLYPIPPDGCPETDQVVHLCHATGSTVIPYVILTVSSDEDFSGHVDHKDDIIPAPAEGCPEPQVQESMCTSFVIFHTFRDGDLEIYRLDGVESSDNYTLINLSQGPDSEDSRPSRSSDDRFVVFESDRNGNIELYLNFTNGGNPIRLTDTTANNINPMFMFGNEHIVYQSDRNGNWDIYIMDMSNGEEHQLTTDPGDDVFPYASPDPEWIAYQNNRSGNWDIYLLNIISGEEIQFTNNEANDTYPAWSPNGKFLAFLSDSAGYNDLWVYNLVTGEKTLVSEGNGRDANNHAWSPEGSRIAYQSNRGGNLDVYSYDLVEDEEYRLSSYNGVDSSPTWDCGGVNVSFTSMRDGDPNIFKVFWQGGSQTNLTTHPATDKWSEWSPGKEQASRGE